MRALIRFFLLGAALFAAKVGLTRVVSEGTPRAVTVLVKESATGAELERAENEAVLVEEALAHGGATVDPIVRERLLQAMRRVSGAATAREDDDASLLANAVALGLAHADAVVRQRLAFQAEQLLLARTSTEPVPEAELVRYHAAQRSRYDEPARHSISQVFLARAGHGDHLASDASRLRARLVGGAGAAGSGIAPTGDASLLPAEIDDADVELLDGRFGPGFGAAVAAVDVGTWSLPIPSSFGLHLVYVRKRREAESPPLAAIRARVLADYRHDHRHEVLSERLRALRAAYRFDVRRLHS